MPERLIRLLAYPGGTTLRRVENDKWQTVGLAADGDLAQLPPGPLLVPLAVWKSRREELLARGEPVGVWLAADENPGDLAGDVAKLSVIAVQFPKWGDGRGHSTGALLRTRYGFRGELRAFGDIGRDLLFDLARCGFDAFKLPPQRHPEDALASFGDFSLRYQGSVDDPVPLFRKRPAPGASR